MRRLPFLPGALALLVGLAALSSAFAQPVPPVGPVPGPPVPGFTRATTAAKAPAEGTQLSDDEVLKQAGLSPTDGAKLVGYLKLRTLSETDRGKIDAIIRRFGADAYEDREKASEEIELFGPAAVKPLRDAEKDSDPEVAHRASQALRRLEKVPHAAVAAAAARAVVKLKPPDAATALLGYLPSADTDAVAEDIRAALVALAVRDGKPEPALLAALNEPSPVRRAAAYVALSEGGPAGERVRIKDAYPKVVEAVRKDPDPEAKFRGLWSLLLTTREKEFVPDLIGMVPQLPRGRLWQLEDLLLQLAGKAPAGGSFGKTPEALAAARDAWLAWWKKQGPATDLVKLELKPRVQGFTDLILFDNRYGQSVVVRLGPDLKEKWQFSGGSNPSDVRVLPNGHILVAEQNSSRVTERDATGKILSERRMNLPLSIDVLPDGGTLVVGRGQVIHYDKDGNPVDSYSRSNFDIVAGRRLPNGEVVFLTNTGQGGANCFRLDAKLKDTGKSSTLGRVHPIHVMDVLGDDRILVCETDQVVEYDLKTGKAGWAYKVSQPTSCQRLPNGNTLIGCTNLNQAIEVTPAGEVVWEYQAKDGLKVYRAYRR